MTVHAETASPIYAVTENFSDKTLESFTFDKIISSSVGTANIIKDSNGKVSGIKWHLDHADFEQSVVYRLLLNNTVPDDLIDKEINVSSADVDFTNSQGKITNIAYPNVSVKVVKPTAQSNLTYNANGGNGDNIVLSLTTGSKITVAESTFTKADHTFLRWNTASDGGGTSYSSGDTITITGDITLYAQWETIPAVSFAVNYDANAGIGSHIDADITSGSNYSVKSANDVEINKSGYYLIFWNTVQDGSGTSYSPGDMITVTGNITLYAQWSAIIID